MANKNAWLIVIVIVGVIIAMQYIGKPSSTTTTTTTVPTSGNIITTNPKIQVAGSDAQAAGTAVSMSAQYAVDGGSYASATLGSTEAIPGQKVELFLTNGTGYHNQYVPAITVTPQSFPVSVKFNKNATITENVYTTTGLVISNGGGTQNQTALGAGTTYNFKDEMTANALTSTQDMICIIEITNGTCVDTSVGVKFGGQSAFSTAKPTWYSVAGGNSAVYLFNMPALSTTATATNTISAPSKGTVCDFTATSRLIKSCYTKEWFLDPNTGKATFDVADSNGNLKSMAKYAYTVYFN